MPLSPQAMVFAAGRGIRMGALTRTRPKPLIEVGGRALIDHALDLLAEAGLRRAVVNTHYLGGMIAAHLAARTDLELALSPEAELLETGGGIKAARALLGEGPVLTLNADAVWRGDNPVRQLLAGAGAEAGGATLLLAPRDAALGHRGVGDFFLGDDGRLGRRGQAATAPFVYTGVQLIDPAPVYGWPAAVFSLNAVWDRMIAAGRLRGLVYRGSWCDVGQPESLPLAEGLVAP